jgi:hypothetical protein
MSDFLHLDTISIVAAILGGFILLHGLCSLFIKERLYLSEVCKYYTPYDKQKTHSYQ